MVWDAICDAFEYIISFEWLGDLFDFIGSMFEGLGELSIMGIIFGVLGAGMIYLLRDYMLQPFLMNMGTMEAIFWGGATYVCTFIAGYLLGKGFDNT